MKKPSWLPYFGWGALVSAIALGVTIALDPGLFRNPMLLIVLVAWMVVTVGLVMFWVMIRGMIWVADRSARAQAAITCDVLADLVNRMQMLTADPAEAPQNGSWENPPTGIACDACGRPKAMLHCRKHRATLCFPCTGKHDSDDCAYIAADRHAQVLQKPAKSPEMIGKLLGI
ncbi:MAG TPA: hypothetical protein VFZ27_10240 [Terriglobia bacterium]|nr:hypothetical protein [Terriglobia bacterium]